MSIELLITAIVYCDIEGCDEQTSFDTADLENAADLATAAGWGVTPDRCPDHRWH